jgi:hypothetical protein
MSAERLALGDLIHCGKCRGWHPAEEPRSGGQTDYGDGILIIRCGADLFYAGQQDRPSRNPTRVRCGRCRGERRICQAHPHREWPHDDCTGPGEPCPRCNMGESPALRVHRT